MRKFWLGVSFMTVSGVLSWAAIQHGTDLVGLATVIGAIAGGVFGVVWGNSQEWKAKAEPK